MYTHTHIYIHIHRCGSVCVFSRSFNHKASVNWYFCKDIDVIIYVVWMLICVHASGIRQLQACLSVVGLRLSLRKPTQREVTTMRSSDLVVVEDHMAGPGYQRYNWQTDRRGSTAFGSSPRRGKTLI